jgi:hypothetical protein
MKVFRRKALERKGASLSLSVVWVYREEKKVRVLGS